MLVILSTHPIQYQVPLWQALAKDGSVPFEVWYLTAHGVRPSYDRQFGKSFAWDLDVLSGYPHRFLDVNSTVDVSSFSKLRISGALRPLFRDTRVSALWVQGWQVLAYWEAVWQARRAGVPVWLRGESNDLVTVQSYLKRHVKRRVLRKLFERVQNFLYIGKANRRLYESFGVRSEQLSYAPYCVDNDRFASQAESLAPKRNDIRRQWGISENAFCVMFAAKFIEKKRPFDLIRAAADSRFKGLGRPLHLLFVGSGELGASMRDACNVSFDAEEHSVKADENKTGLPAASFAGFLNQTEISKAYVAADCLVLPSDSRETWGLVVNEAMASGLPCIVSDACGCAEDLVAPINPAYCFPLGDHNSLASALLDMARRPCPPSVLKEHVSKYHIGVTVDSVTSLFRRGVPGTNVA
jgi:glycosyltransferase involved in cell wall biosynthesis